MNSPTIVRALKPLQAMELACIVYGAHHLYVPCITHRRSRGYDHSTYGKHHPKPIGRSGRSSANPTSVSP